MANTDYSKNAAIIKGDEKRELTQLLQYLVNNYVKLLLWLQSLFSLPSSKVNSTSPASSIVHDTIAADS